MPHIELGDALDDEPRIDQTLVAALVVLLCRDAPVEALAVDLEDQGSVSVAKVQRPTQLSPPESIWRRRVVIPADLAISWNRASKLLSGGQ